INAERVMSGAKTSNCKLQTPEKLQIPNSNAEDFCASWVHRPRRKPCGFGVWGLGLLWSLVVGIWCFSTAAFAADPAAKINVLVVKGSGWVVLHHALVSYQHWPEYEKIIGGRYPEAEGKSGVVTAETGYQHDVEIPVLIVAKEHPVTAGLKDFTIHDEIYWGF